MPKGFEQLKTLVVIVQGSICLAVLT